MKKTSLHSTLPLKRIIVLTLLFATLFTSSPVVQAADTYTYDSSLKEMSFLLHSLDQPAVIGGQETKYIMDTTHTYRFQTQEQAIAGSLLKPIGLPKITLNFFLSPTLSTPVTLEGQWKASIWVNSTAYKPVGFTVELKEISQTGEILFNTGQQSPVVISSIGEHLDVQVTNFVLIAPINHTFQVGSTIQATIDINAGSSSENRVWFDSPLYPSKITLPSTDYARPVEIKTFAADGASTNTFDIDASAEKRSITLSSNITDPYSAYDIASVQATILYNATQKVAGPITMALTQPGPVKQLYSAAWNYPANVLPGNYTAIINVIDNNGMYQAQQTGNAEPYTEQGKHSLQIGPITYLNPTIKIIDEAGDPLADAQVLVTYPTGVRDELPRPTTVNGTLTLTRVIPADYTFTVLWKNSLVAHSTLKIESDDPYTLTAEVYQLNVTVADNTGKPVSGAYVFAYRDGLGYGFDVTEANGIVELKLPEGTYDLETRYATSYLLSSVSAVSEKSDVSVSDSTAITLSFNDYPPPIWTTTGFVLIVIGAIMLIVILVIIRRN